MNSMTESRVVQRINAQCHPLLLYMHKFSGVHYLATYDSACTYELNPLHGQSRRATVQELADADIWQQLH